MHAARGATAGMENDINDVICVPIVGARWWCPSPVERGTHNVIYIILLAEASQGHMYVGQTARCALRPACRTARVKGRLAHSLSGI